MTPLPPPVGHHPDNGAYKVPTGLGLEDLADLGIPVCIVRIPANFMMTSGIRVVEGRRAERRMRAVWKARDKRRRRAQRRAWRREYPWSTRHRFLAGVLWALLLLAIPVLYVLAP